ncbi:MAG: hypothetical protein IT349_19235 [Candidatus Eisenbacteria bacterium]|nr:hypothetical protein [Candidatus Eisenbacteria bacterium]
MAEEIRLVQNDRHPDVYFTLTDRDTGDAIDVTNAVVKLHFRALNATSVKASITATKPNGGADGYVKFSWPAGALDTPGPYEGEIELEFLDSTKHTVFDKPLFRVRPEIA